MPFTGNSRGGKTIASKRSVIAWKWDEDKKWLQREKNTFWGHGSMIVVLVAQLYTFTKTYWTKHLKWVNFMACKELYNKTEKNKLLYLYMAFNCLPFYGSVVSQKYSYDKR